MPFIPPPYPPFRTCRCGAEVPLRFVSALNTRNANRPYYVCRQCSDWYRWADGLGNSPRSSPTTSPALAQGNTLPATPALLQPPPSATSDPGGEHCHYTCCGVKRIGRKCQRHMCRKHCRTAGGCTADGHSVIGAAPLNPPPMSTPVSSIGSDSTLPSLASTSSSSLVSSDHSSVVGPSSSVSSSSSMANIDPALFPPSSAASDDLFSFPSLPMNLDARSSGCPPISQPSNIDGRSSACSPVGQPRVQMADASANPRHLTQLRPIFVEHVARTHERTEKKRQRDEELVLEKKRVHESVLAFAFTKDGEEPITVDVQDGFTYPFFKLSRSVLLDLELIMPEDDTVTPPIIHYFDPRIDGWVKKKMNGVIELAGPSQRLFFKAINVTSYPDFDHLFDSSAVRKPNPRISLSQERAHVKKTQTKMQARTLSTCDTLLELSSDEDSHHGHSWSSPRKRPHKAPTMQHTYSDADLSDSDEVEIVATSHDDDITVEDLLMPATARLVPDVPRAKFPSTFYAVDIHRAFRFTPTKNLTFEAWFAQFFQVPYKTSTFYAHRARWLSSPLDARMRAIAAGYSEEGRYSVFMKAHPAKNADNDS